MSAYFAYINDLVVGPYSQQELCRFLKTGRITADTLVERQGKNRSEWKALRNYPELLVPEETAEDIRSGQFVRYDGDMIVFCCPNCSQKYKLSQKDAEGNRVFCENCDTLIAIPSAGSGATVSAEEKPAETALAFDSSMEISGGDLVCPHCWKNFSQENLLYIAVHPTLVGDPIVGEFEPRRFRPGVFNQLGQPLDECGIPATEMACPHCHLRFPAGMLDSPSVYFSIAGATASGKSYFLTCQAHVLRQILPRYFSTSFYDLDPRLNETLSRYENQLFQPLDGSKITTLPATQLSGEGISDRIIQDGVEIELPKPFVFDYQPDGKPEQRRNLVFYDNSGELFTPGRDEWVNQATRHLSHADGITFLFDPASDSGMRSHICNPKDPQVTLHPRVLNQTTLLTELISRIRRHANMTATDTCSIPLVIAVCKYDIWREAFPVELGNSCLQEEENCYLDLNKVLNVSFHLRQMLLCYAPGLVNAAESFFQRVYFVPVSAFGTLAELDSNGYIGVVSNKIRPIWIEVPFLTIMHETEQLPALLKKGQEIPAQNFKSKLENNRVVFQHPVTKERISLPCNYAGARLCIEGQYYDLPKPPRRATEDNHPERLVLKYVPTDLHIHSQRAH